MSLSQDIESRIAILDVVNRYVQTKKAGVNYKALCPFHQEKTASFVISPAKNIAKCFSCGKGGGPIRFLMEIENIEFREAASILAKEAGIEMKTSFSWESQEKWKDAYLAHKLATDWYHEHLFSSEGKRALEYLLHRGISEETIRAFRLGYSSSPRDLLYFLKQQGFDTAFLIECGLFVSESRDKFFGRVVFPIANAMGNTVAFTGRILDKGEPKYLNSPASRIFDKSAILYGLHLAKQSIAKTGKTYIVEGQMDTIALHQAWVVQAVGISGTALTQDHVRILKRFTKVVYLMLDSDDAGIRATFASIESLLNSDIEIRIIQIPSGKDPDEFIQSWWNFEELEHSSLSAIEYYIAMGKRQYNTDTLVGQKQLVEKCLELVARIVSPIETDFYIKHLAQSFGLGRDVLYESLYRVRKYLLTKQKTTENETPFSHHFSPTVADQLAGYIDKFKLLDLFFANFRYTIDELSQLSGTGLLLRVLQGEVPDNDEDELLKTMNVYIDETQTEQHSDIISRKFLDLIRELHVALFLNERKNTLASIDPNSNEYLEAQRQFVTKGLELGIHPSKTGSIL